MSTFTVPTLTPATFHATIQDSRQEIGDLQRMTLRVLLDDGTEWLNLQALVTRKYSVQTTLDGTVILDILRGPGVGALAIDGMGLTDAMLVDLGRNRYLPADRSLAMATFLLTGDPL